MPSYDPTELARLYTFGCQIGDLKFANFISDALLSEFGTSHVGPNLDMLKFICTEDGEDASMLRRLSLDWYRYHLRPNC